MRKESYDTILNLTKSLANIYFNATLEASNQKVRDTFETSLITTLTLQNEIYKQMTEDGYYTVENVKKTDINKLYKKLKGNE